MTDYLPPPPAEIDLSGIVLEPPTLEQRYDPNHSFVYKSNDEFRETSARYFEAIYDGYNRQSRILSAVEQVLREAVSESSIDMDLAQSFADELGISLNRTITFTLTYEVSGSMEIGHDVDPEDVLSNLEVSVSTGYYSDVEDFDADDVNLTYSDWSEE